MADWKDFKNYFLFIDRKLTFFPQTDPFSAHSSFRALFVSLDDPHKVVHSLIRNGVIISYDILIRTYGVQVKFVSTLISSPENLF